LYLGAAAKVNPEAVIRAAEDRKAQVFNKVKLAIFQTVGAIRRTDPSGERAKFLKAVMDILAEKRRNGYLPTSQRSIHYQLLQWRVQTATC